MAVQSVSVDEMRSLLQKNERLCIVDVRTPGEFARMHAAGARLAPLDELDPRQIAAWALDSGGRVYVICHSGARGAKACEKLQAAGIGGAVNIEGGTAAWEKLGLPVERQARGSIAMERQVRIVAGTLVLLGMILAWAVHRYFLGLTAFVGCGLVFAGITDFCGMAKLLAKMPWNRRARA